MTIKAYGEMAGLSYKTVDHMLNSGQLPYITTESGQRKIDTQVQVDLSGEVAERLEGLDQKLKALGDHLGVKVR